MSDAADMPRVHMRTPTSFSGLFGPLCGAWSRNMAEDRALVTCRDCLWRMRYSWPPPSGESGRNR